MPLHATHRCHPVIATTLSLLALASVPASAQAPPVPPGSWIGAVGAGVALTSGNTDTSTVNASYDITYDPKTRHVVKSDAVYLRGKKDDELILNRIAFNGRDQYTLAPRAFVFGQFQYLRDTFKAIDYLAAPTVGLGYKLIDSPITAFTVDGGIGGVWEKNPAAAVRRSGALTASQRVTHKLSDTATFLQQLSGLWKTNDTSDALYNFGVGVAASLTQKSQVKIELIDSYKAKPPTAATRKNDVAFLFSIGYKL
jgi:putative salt-induced outer membrane protein YdiY